MMALGHLALLKSIPVHLLPLKFWCPTRLVFLCTCLLMHLSRPSSVYLHTKYEQEALKSHAGHFPTTYSMWEQGSDVPPPQAHLVQVHGGEAAVG